MDNMVCNCLKEKALNRCNQHGNHCPDNVIQLFKGFSGYDFGIPLSPVVGGGYIKINYCPFCGEKINIKKGEIKMFTEGKEGGKYE